MIGTACATAHVEALALRPDKHSGQYVARSAKSLPPVKYRNPVDLWIEATHAQGSSEPVEALPAWCATLTLRTDTGDQSVELVRQMLAGIEIEMKGDLISFKILELQNQFNSGSAHPTHLRKCFVHMLFTSEKAGSVPVRIEIEHKDLVAALNSDTNFNNAYDFFWSRTLGMTQPAFDVKLEVLLTFLVEAIGVPVLLSLLLLTYSATKGAKEGNSYVLDLDELPDTRLQLYKLGISAGIKKRMLLEANSRQGKEKEKLEAKEAEAKAAASQEEASGAANKRSKRKTTLEENMGSAYASSGAAPAKNDDTEAGKVQKRGEKHHSDGPVMDLNSILRGKKVRVVTGEDEVADCYALCVRVLSKSKQPGFDMRTGIVAVVPKSHPMHAIVTALIEYVLMPPPQSEAQLNDVAIKMLRRVAVDNQENGRREFTSKDVACVLGAHPDELGLWSRLDLNDDHGVALAATLAKQTDKAPAQYQFKHLSFQEGLYAEYLLLIVTSLAPPSGPGWDGWQDDMEAATFLNNRYMNNTCRIAAGYLGGLLALQRSAWDFREAPLSDNGRSALLFITDANPEVESINIANNDVGFDNVQGLCKMLSSCPKLYTLDLSNNELFKLVESHSYWHRLCEAFTNNRTLTDLNLSNNKLGMNGVRMAANSLHSLKTLKRLGFSYNEPSVEPALAELLRKHPALESVALVEALDRHLPTRAKDEIGRALLENKAARLSFLQCDMFALTEETKQLTWPKEASTSDAVLIAGALRANSVLTAFNLAPGASLDAKARSEIGYALLNNPNSVVAYCNDFGLTPTVDTCEFDLARTELKDPEPFQLLAGCMAGNRTLTHVKLLNVRMEHLATLAQALKGNDKLQVLEIVTASRGGGTSVVLLPVPELNGSKEGGSSKRVDMSQTCADGALSRVTCGMIGSLVASNTTLECLDLTGTGVGVAIGQEGEGGHILFRPLCQDNECPIGEVVLNDVQLNDKAGGKLVSALVEGLGKGDHGYEKITSICVAGNDLGKQFTTALKQLLWSERAQCVIKSLNVSNNLNLDGYDFAVSLKRNDSLTSIDYRGVPSANTGDIHSFIGSYLLQDDCACRLGYLACDAFEVTPTQTELVYNQQRDEGAEPLPSGKVEPLILLLAGVVKFNANLKSLTLSTGLNNMGAESVATALKNNQTLEHLDVSGDHEMDATGIEMICGAIRSHPKLQSVKIEGSTALPISQLRGTQGGEAVLKVAHWNLGVHSAHAMGTLLRGNQLVSSLDLDHNQFGANGIKAIIEGCGEAPIRSLHMKSTGLQGAEDEDILSLSKSVNMYLGQLSELRMDENDLVCAEDALAPICKLRNLRLLSMEKNRLARIPTLIGTMLSLKHLLLYSNQLVELPVSVCLITGLEVLDVHKNMITTLPSIIGKLTSLKKLDVSENKITELPISICELSEEVGLSVGRNPLEKPAVEQARQGIGVIRRFFGWSKKDATADAPEPVAQPGGERMFANGKSKAERPHPDKSAPSRHNWASPGAVVILFNCHGCTFSLVEGSDTTPLMSESDDVNMTCAFNMQVVGRFRAPRDHSDTFADRIEFDNDWLPWSTQTVKPEEAPSVLIQIKGRGRAAANLLAVPWLSYGCSIGARLRTPGGYATVMEVCEDDTCGVQYDGVHNKDKKAGVEITRIGQEQQIDPRPDTVARTLSPSYKAGQVLALVHEKRLVDATVETWFGLQHGSRHKVRLGPKSGAAAQRSKKDAAKNVIELDLNEENHAKLVMSSVAKYENARTSLLEATQMEYASVYDAVIKQAVKVADQRLYVRQFDPKPPAEEKSGGEEISGDNDVSAPAASTTEEQGLNALRLLDELIAPSTEAAAPPPPLVVRTHSQAEFDLLHAQSLSSLTSTLLSKGPKSELRQVPVALSLARLADMMNDEAKRTNARDMILKSFEASYPKRANANEASDVLKQAIELRALVIIADIRSEYDFSALKSEAVVEELLTGRLLILVSDEVGHKLSEEMPPSLLERCKFREADTWGCFMNDARLTNYEVKQLLTQMRPQAGRLPSHYERVSALHLSTAQLGADAQQDLAEYLKLETCILRTLDLSNTHIDAAAISQALALNSSLRSVDVRAIPKMAESFEKLGDMLLQPNSTSRLAYIRCDAFEVLEGETVLSLRERPLVKGAMRLLTGLLKHNREVLELDLAATRLQKDWATTLIEAIATNPSITAVNLPFNPAIDEAGQVALVAAVEGKNLKITLHF